MSRRGPTKRELDRWILIAQLRKPGPDGVPLSSLNSIAKAFRMTRSQVLHAQRRGNEVLGFEALIAFIRWCVYPEEHVDEGHVALHGVRRAALQSRPRAVAVEGGRSGAEG